MRVALPKPNPALADGVEPGAIRRVLIVDDSRAQLRVLSALLARWGYEVSAAETAEDAIAALERRPHDLVVSDWVMPGMDGLALCRAIRARQRWRYVYVILLTSRDAREDAATGLAAGADDFATKPVRADELRGRIAAADRLLAMQKALREKNRVIGETLRELQAVHDRLARDLVEARLLQQSLVPERHLAYDGTDVSLLLHPSGHVGGDLVGAFRASGTQIGIYAIDVSGHGIASALMTARLSGLLTGKSPQHNVALTIDEFGLYRMKPAEEICAALNRIVLDEMETELYLTMAIAECDLTTGRARIVQAGHPAPLLLRGAGDAEHLGRGGYPVGLLSEATYKAFDVDLAPGDRLLLYSDGLSDCETGDGGPLGAEGVAELAGELAGLPGPEFMDALMWRLSGERGDTEVVDDISAVLLEFRGRRSAD